MACMIVFGFSYYFFAVYALQINKRAAYFKSPPTVNCEALEELYPAYDLERLTVMETLNQVDEFESAGASIALNELVSHTGA